MQDALTLLGGEALHMVASSFRASTAILPMGTCRLCYLCGFAAYECLRDGRSCMFTRPLTDRTTPPGSALFYDLVILPILNDQRNMAWNRNWKSS